jgi:16S rRNA (cytidine1402-2'-O)-methyltransferase
MELPKETSTSGCLYLVATPIGNLEDITLRALRVLREADVVACEDTRQTQILLRHYDMQKRLVSYHEHNELTRAAELVIELEQGARVALVSDAGTPVISDPGHRLVALCLRHRIPVVPVPGASAFVAALAASGMPANEFLFVGFLPSRAGERRRALAELAAHPGTLIFYEAPHRLVAMLEDARDILGNRNAVVAREVTKRHEEFLRGTLSELQDQFERRAPRGEITVLIAPHAPAAQRAPAADGSLARRVEELVHSAGLDQKTALKQAAREFGVTRREAYQLLLREKDVAHTPGSN